MALYDSENNRLLDVNGNVLLARSVSFLGTDEIKKIYVGENEVQKVYIGTTLVYEKPIVIPQLQAPVISLSGDTLSIEEVENAEYYDIYVDGVLKESIDVRPNYSVTFNFTDSQAGSKDSIKIYDGRNDNGTLLFESSGQVSTPSASVTCRTGYLFVGISGDNASLKNIVTSENISIETDSYLPEEFDDWTLFKVEGNGTITATLDWSD